MEPLLALAVAIVLDLAIGCPPWPYHPVRLIGRLATNLEPRMRRLLPRSERLAGILFVLGILTIVLIASAWLYRVPWTWRWPIEGVLLHFCLAYRCLRDEGRRVMTALGDGKIDEARERLQWLVSRDVSQAPPTHIIRGTIETMMENSSDAIIAPLFWFAVGGAPAALLYKAVNTMDSMVGYRTPRYLAFGWAAARLDDLVNLIPARLTGILMVIAAAILGGSPRMALRAWWRDAQKGPSPNGGIPIVTFAGAEDIGLGGDCVNPDGSIIHIPHVGGHRATLLIADAHRALHYLGLITALALITVAWTRY